jgi:DNA-binding transcriptional ArsR family regulator
MKPTRPEKQISRFLQSISPAPRIQMLLAIGEGEACVCHLETMLGLRQAYISQHLMALRQAKIVTHRREGRNIFYRLSSPDTLTLIRQTGALLGLPEGVLQSSSLTQKVLTCLCPHCNEEQASLIPSRAVTLSAG